MFFLFQIYFHGMKKNLKLTKLSYGGNQKMLKRYKRSVIPAKRKKTNEWKKQMLEYTLPPSVSYLE